MILELKATFESKNIKLKSKSEIHCGMVVALQREMLDVVYVCYVYLVCIIHGAYAYWNLSLCSFFDILGDYASQGNDICR